MDWYASYDARLAAHALHGVGDCSTAHRGAPGQGPASQILKVVSGFALMANGKDLRESVTGIHAVQRNVACSAALDHKFAQSRRDAAAYARMPL